VTGIEDIVDVPVPIDDPESELMNSSPIWIVFPVKLM